jgi:hypothetical protein
MTLLVLQTWLAVGRPDADQTFRELWSSTDLLARCRRHARRPVTDQSMTDPDWYAFLTEAQPEVYRELFARAPELGFGAPQPMFSDDGGLTYTFGLDAANEDAYPMGHVEIYPSLSAIPDDPLEEGEDFIAEGDRIRMLGNRARIYDSGNGPYARVILTPDIPISDVYEPLLYPKPARMLLVWAALESWAARPGSQVDPAYYAAKYQQTFDSVLLDRAVAYNRGRRKTTYTGLELGILGIHPSGHP